MTNPILTLLSKARLEQEYASGYWRDDTIFSLASRWAALSPDKIAVRDRTGSVTYGDLVGRANALANRLLEAGLRPGHRVAVWLPSRIETAIAFLACSRDGYVCCPSLHRDHTTADVLELLQRMRAAAFVGEVGYGADAATRDIFGHLGDVLTLKQVFRLLPAGRSGHQEANGPLSASDTGAGEGVNADPNAVVYLAFTSGTTGRPKGVMHSDNTLLANARAMIADWQFDARTIIYTMSPLSHNLGLGSLVMSIATGGELVIHDVPRGASMLDRIVEVGATFIVGVPTHAMDLLGEIKARGVAAPKTVKGFRISGAAAPKALVAELLHHGIVPQSGYGMTEAGSHHYTRMNDDPDKIVQTSGRVCDSYEVKIWSRDNADVELPVGEVGQIGGRGSTLMLGYFDDQSANDEAFNASGWFMTGDLGRLDADGYLQITGRKKDLIIRGGHNIYPARIENLAMQHPAVARAAVLPVPDQRLGEKVCLAVALRTGQAVEPDELLAHLNRLGLSRYDMPEYYLQLDEIPLTASGKILKLGLAAQLLDGTITPVAVRWTAPGTAPAK
jgi:acyl-CoA synthetase